MVWETQMSDRTSRPAHRHRRSKIPGCFKLLKALGEIRDLRHANMFKPTCSGLRDCSRNAELRVAQARITPPTPNAAAERIMAPRLRGSFTPSRATRWGYRSLGHDLCGQVDQSVREMAMLRKQQFLGALLSLPPALTEEPERFRSVSHAPTASAITWCRRFPSFPSASQMCSIRRVPTA